jgi:hypothetical protein
MSLALLPVKELMMSFRSPLPRPKNCDSKYQHTYDRKRETRRPSYRWSKSK